jgi:dienelactone hydrolase
MGHRRIEATRTALLPALVAAMLAGATGCGSRSAPGTGAVPTGPIAATSASPAVRPAPDPAPDPASSPTPTFDPEAFKPPAVSRSALVKMFAYDPGASLALVNGGSRRDGDATVAQVSYLAHGRRVNAQLVYPATRHGRLPGVVLAHGGAIDPDAFLPEALDLAAHGMVSILPDIPMTIVGDARTDIGMVTDAVIAERRALDILAARPDVDPGRLAFVGHSWGGDLATIMAGVEPRLAAVAVVCGSSRIATDMVAMGSPAQAPAYMAATSALDGYRFVAIPGRRRILIQFGRLDTSIPDAQRTELTGAAVGRVTRRDYDAGHDLVNNAPAAADRLAFLTSALAGR